MSFFNGKCPINQKTWKRDNSPESQHGMDEYSRVYYCGANHKRENGVMRDRACCGKLYTHKHLSLDVIDDGNGMSQLSRDPAR